MSLDAVILTTSTPDVLQVPPEVPPGTPLALSSPVPNPSDGGVRLWLMMSREARVRVRLHDLSGRVVRVLADAEFGPGAHALSWDGRDGNGNPQPSGIYYLKAETGDRVAVRKLVRIR